MNYQQAVDYIHSFQKFGWLLGRLERIAELLRRLGDPQKKLKFIHIAGTNGKGSTAAMSANVLQDAGYQCGLFLSPYVIDFRERFQVNGEMITKEEFVSLVELVKPTIEAMYQEEIMITEFEVITVISFLYFARHDCDFVVLETGLGGGDDATNVIESPVLCAITSISLDHMNILGDTIKEIAGHKAGIIKPNSTVVCYDKQHIDAVAVLMEQCANTNSMLIQPNPANIQQLKHGVTGSHFRYEGIDYDIMLTGIHQVDNAVTVIEMMKALRQKGYHIADSSIRSGLARTSFPARFQILHKHPFVVLDGAHNLESAQALSQTLSEISEKKVLIIGMLADKDYEHSLQLLCEACDEVICVPVDNPRALPCETLCETASQFQKASYEQDLSVAYQTALQSVGKDGWVVVCGSFYLAGTFLQQVSVE